MCQNVIILFISFTLNYLISNCLTIGEITSFISCPVNDSHDISKQMTALSDGRQLSAIDIEIGVYFDDYLHQKFNRNDQQLSKYIKTLLRGAQVVYDYPSMRRRVNLIVTRYEKVPSVVVPYNQSLYIYYNALCNWQSKNKSQNYDLALFLTSKNLFHGSNPSVNGYGSISKACYPKDDNCVLVKADQIGSMWTIAHEIGHKLGMNHDNPLCGVGVMWPSQKSPFRWSDCSNSYIDNFIANSKLSGCLFKRSGNPITGWNSNLYPGDSYTVDQQCAINFGQQFKISKFRFKYYNENSCADLWCYHDMIHLERGPPLEGTGCYNVTEKLNGRCIQGFCVR